MTCKSRQIPNCKYLKHESDYVVMQMLVINSQAQFSTSHGKL